MGYPEQLTDFDPIPWAQALINDPSFQPIKSFSRIPPAPWKTENAMLASSLNNASCVRAVASYHHFPPPGLPTSPQTYLGNETRMIISLGTGINGHEGFVAGGFIGSLIDETMAQCVATIFGRDFVTASMELKYRKMITTPRVLLGRAWIEEEVVRKKVWLKASLEDGEGLVFTTGRALFILTKLPKL